MSKLKTPTKLILQTLVRPNDLNQHGTAFGGMILSQLDMAGAVVAMKRAGHKIVLAAVKESNFMCPVYMADQISIYGEVVKVGNTSLEVELEMWREDPAYNDKPELAANGTFIYVAVHEETLKPVKVD